MIRINLLKPLQAPTSSPMSLDDSGGRRKTTTLVVGGLAVVALAVVLVLQYPTLFGGLLGGRKPPVAAKTHKNPPQPKPSETPAEKPKPVTADAVEETVRDLGNNKSETQVMNRSYADLVPSERIEFQYFACEKILKDIKAVTPPDVGFADFIFTIPGEFYVHGLAGDAESMQKFQDGLKGMSGAAVKPGLNVAAGAHHEGKEFSFLGSVKYPVDGLPIPPDHVLNKAGLAQEFSKLKSAAKSLGIVLKEPRLLNAADVGANKRMVYETSGDCSFQQIQDLLGELRQAKSHLGILKFDLHARGDEKVVADLAILAYVK